MKRVVLASRSPRRRELLSLIVAEDSIQVLPPRSADEAGFEELHDWPSIVRQAAMIAREKCDDVCRQLAEAQTPFDAVVAADTVIVGEGRQGQLCVLGQPPETDDWRETVAGWFREFYFGREHIALTALCVADCDGNRRERTTSTKVAMAADREDLLDWYLSTDEPLGKAGGYAIQGAGSMFVTSISGSFSNVVGLPLEDLERVLHELHLSPLAR